MTLFDAFRYDGKRVLVVGGATGMGAAAAELVQDAGAEVVVMDFAEVTLAGAKAIHVDLADRASIDAAIAECGGPVDVLMSCAGVADGTPGIERINFIGHRHMIDTLIAGGMLGRGASIGFISSAAGLGWEANLPEIQESWPHRTSTARWRGWRRTARRTTCRPSRPCAPTWPARPSPSLKQGIRINAICPGPTDTPLAQANKDMWLGFGADYRGEVGHRGRHPARAGLPPGLPVQRRRLRRHRNHHDHRRGLHELGDHRVPSRAPPPSPTCCSSGSPVAGGPPSPADPSPCSDRRPGDDGHRRDVGTGPTAQHGVHDPDQFVYVDQRTAQTGCVPARWDGTRRPGPSPSRWRTRCPTVPSPPAQSPTMTRVKPTAGCSVRHASTSGLQRRLAGGVGPEAGPWRGEGGTDRGEVGGHAPGLGEMGDGRRRDQCRTRSTLVLKVSAPGFAADVDQPPEGTDPGGVDEGVDAAQSPGRLLDGRRARLVIGDVADDGQRARARPPWPRRPAGPCAGPAGPPLPPLAEAGGDASGRGRSMRRRRLFS